MKGLSTLRAGIFCDFAEENWPSMDLCADMLLHGLNSQGLECVDATRVQPRMKRRVHPWLRSNGGLNADRLINRLWDYPVSVRHFSQFDICHVIDHSYAQLVHVLRPERTVVTCHDTDTFRCLLDPEAEPRPYWFRTMARHILRGLEKAAAIVCVSDATRRLLLQHGIGDPSKISLVHNGVHPCFQSASQGSWESDALWEIEAERLLGPRDRTIDLLHVGSTVPRKRIDILLRVFADVAHEISGHDGRKLRLVRVGPPLTRGLRELACALGIERDVVCLPLLDRELLAAVYRRSALVLTTSESEGFGLPVVESMACGTPVVASDIASLREVGGTAASYCAVGDIAVWSETVLSLLEERALRPVEWEERVERSRERARAFSWDRNAREVAAVYRMVCSKN